VLPLVELKVNGGLFMYKKSRSIALLSLLAVIPFSVVSCSGGASYNIDNFLINGTEENPYQIVKEPVSIKIFAPKSSSNPEFKDLKMFQYLSKITNLNFEFTTPDTSAYQARRAAVWEDSSYKPDLFLFNNAISEQVTYQENNFNALVPFNSDTFANSTGNVGNIIDQYMPNYKEGLGNNFNIDTNKEVATDAATLSDGKMYATLSVSDVARDLTYKMFINNVWIKNVYKGYPSSYCYKNNIQSADDISTIDDYVGVLTDFKNFDANGNGDSTDEVPVSSKSLTYLRNFILQSYGYVSYGPEIENDGSKFTYVPTTDAYRKYLQTANKMWANGLMDSSTFSITSDSGMAKKGIQGLLGSFVAAAPYLITGQAKDQYNKNDNNENYALDEEYSTIAPLLSSSYSGPRIQLGFGSFKPDGACIPATSIYVREVARLLDIMYSELGTQLISYGVEGEDWHWNDDAKTSWTFDVPESYSGTQEDYRGTITPNVGTASALYWSNDFVGKMKDGIISRLNEQSSIYTQYLKVPEPSKYKFKSSEYNAISTIKATLDTQIEYLEQSYVRGTDGSNPNDNASWNSYITKVNKYSSLNGTTLIDIYNTMLKRY
jgi:putative aldouronate transport system substrate-binding protein